MNLVAEHGIAAHWKYKEGTRRVALAEDDKKFAWLRQLMESQKELRDPTEFLESVKIDLFGDEVYVFTPRRRRQGAAQGQLPDRLRVRGALARSATTARARASTA